MKGESAGCGLPELLPLRPVPVGVVDVVVGEEEVEEMGAVVTEKDATISTGGRHRLNHVGPRVTEIQHALWWTKQWSLTEQAWSSALFCLLICGKAKRFPWNIGGASKID